MAHCISPQQGLDALEQDDTLFVDVRDPASYAQARIPGAVPLTQATLDDFLTETDRQRPLVVYCYHGHSSQSASDFLTDKGFARVVSLDGGFEHWRQAYPEQVEANTQEPPPGADE